MRKTSCKPICVVQHFAVFTLNKININSFFWKCKTWDFNPTKNQHWTLFFCPVSFTYLCDHLDQWPSSCPWSNCKQGKCKYLRIELPVKYCSVSLACGLSSQVIYCTLCPTVIMWFEGYWVPQISKEAPRGALHTPKSSACTLVYMNGWKRCCCGVCLYYFDEGMWQTFVSACEKRA